MAKLKAKWSKGSFEARAQEFLASMLDDGECPDHAPDEPEECYGCIAAAVLKLAEKK